jgi:hypothetical protein
METEGNQSCAFLKHVKRNARNRHFRTKIYETAED